jgi:hypothetical protein
MKKIILIAAGAMLSVAAANAQVVTPDSVKVRTQEEETAGQMNRQRPEGQNTDMYKRTNPVDSAYQNQNKTSDPTGVTRPYQPLPQYDQGYKSDSTGSSTGPQYLPAIPGPQNPNPTSPTGTTPNDVNKSTSPPYDKPKN